MIKEEDIVRAEMTYDSLKDKVHEQRMEIDELKYLLKRIKKLIHKENITGIEVKMILIDMLDKEDF